MNKKKFSLIVLILILLSGCKTDQGSSVDADLQKADNLLSKGFSDKAVNIYRKLLKNNPDNEKIAVKAAEAMIAQGKNRDASDILAKFVSKHPGKPETWYLLGYSRYLERKSNAAIDALENALKLKRDYPEAVLLLGRIYENHEEYLVAKEIYLGVADKLYYGKKLVPILLKLANLELKKSKNLRNVKAAESHLISALKLDPSSETALLTLGNLYLSENKPLKAERLYRSKFKHGKKTGLVLLSYAQALYMNKKYEQALKTYKAAEKKLPDDILPVLGVIKAAEQLKLRDTVYSYLVKASALDPKNREIIKKLIPFYVEKGRYITAMNNLDKIPEKDKNTEEFLKIKTDIYENTGYYRRAYDAWMSIMTVSSKSDDSFKIRAGKLAREAGLYNRAIEFLAPFCKKPAPKNLEICTDLGISYWYAGKKNEGTKLLTELHKRFDSPLPGIWLAQILYMSGKTKKVEKLLADVKKKLKTSDDMLFFYDVKVQLLYKLKKYKECVETLRKEIMLARTDAERSDLKQQLASIEKEMREKKQNAAKHD